MPSEQLPGLSGSLRFSLKQQENTKIDKDNYKFALRIVKGKSSVPSQEQLMLDYKQKKRT